MKLKWIVLMLKDSSDTFFVKQRVFIYPCEAPCCNAVKSQINTSIKLQKKPSFFFFTEDYLFMFWVTLV